MNKEQIAFEKWAVEHNHDIKLNDDKEQVATYYYWTTEDFWTAWQARASLDKQDSLEIVKEIDRVLSPYDLNAPVTTDWIVLLTKIRKHLIKSEEGLLEPTIFAGKLDINEVNKGWE